MGTSKAMLRFGTLTFIERMLREFSDYRDVIVSAASSQQQLPGGIHKEHLVFDEIEAAGPLEGIRQVLKRAENEYVFICAVDMPFLTVNMVEYLQEFICSDYDCYVAEDLTTLHPLCGLYSKKMLPVIEELLSRNQRKIKLLFDRCPTKYVPLKYNPKLLQEVINVNTLEEYFRFLKPGIFAISGTKNSGKTTFIEKLVKELTSRAYRVAVIKHDGHSFEMDHEGTDTNRFTASGAVVTGIYNAEHYVLQGTGDFDLDYCISQITDRRLADVVILEGFKDANIDKFLIVRKATYEAYSFAGNIMGVITDLEESEIPKELKGLHNFGLEDVKGVCDYLKELGFSGFAPL